MYVQDRSFHLLNGANAVFGPSGQMRQIMIRDGISFIGLCLAITGLCALGYQFLLWLKYGSWPALAFRLVLELMGVRELAFPSTSIEKIGIWILDLPLSGFLIVSGLFVMTFGVAITRGACAPGTAGRGLRESILSNFDINLYYRSGTSSRHARND